MSDCAPVGVLVALIVAILAVCGGIWMQFRMLQAVLHDPRNRITHHHRSQTWWAPAFSLRFKFLLPLQNGGRIYRSSDADDGESDDLRALMAKDVQAHRYSVANRLCMKLCGQRVRVSQFDWEINIGEVTFVKKLGSGSYGSVYEGRWHSMKVAVKVLHKTELNHRNKAGEDRFLAEIALMSGLRHPNIVTFIGACVETKRPLLIMECMVMDMRAVLQSAAEVLTLAVRHRFCADIARGMAYLHGRLKIIQRDLKTENVLIDGFLTAKICDFGLARSLPRQRNNKSMTFCGSSVWAAPEILRQEAYDKSADVYSYSITAYEVLTGEVAFKDLQTMEVAYAAAEQGMRPILPPTLSDGYCDLLRRCWDNKPSARPSFAEISVDLLALKHQNDDAMALESADVQAVRNVLGLQQQAPSI